MRTFHSRIIGLVLGLGLSLSQAEAALNLTKVQVIDPNSVDLIFDGKIQPGQIRTEFVRDNIQLTLEDVSVYPAKVSMLSGGEMTKIFAYQYSPKTVRARFTVKGDALTYSKYLHVKANGKIISLRVGAPQAASKKDSITAAQSSSARNSPAIEAASNQIAAASVPTAESKNLLERVTAAQKEEPTESAKAEAKVDSKAESKTLGKKDPIVPASSKKSLGAGKSLPTPFRSIGVMLFILGLLGLFALFMKKAKNGQAGKLSSILGKLGGNTGAKDLIQIVATHALGPKKSIVVMRVQSRTLVLGMTEDSVNLITELNAGEGEDSVDVGDFASSLKKFENDTLPKGPSVALKSNSKLGDLAAAAMGLGIKKANPQVSVVQASPRAQAPNSSSGPSISPTQATTTGLGATKLAAQNAYSQSVQSSPSAKANVRDQIRNRIEGMKQL